jgi:threonine/homoserine/homoserine lactone efflux protein
MFAAAGITLGVLTWGAAAAVGLGKLLAVSRTAYNALRIVGAIYLMYTGVRMFLQSRSSSGSAHEATKTLNARFGRRPSQWFMQGLLTNLLNPKVGVFYVTFLPQFVPVGVNVTAFSMLLACIHAIEGSIWFFAMIHSTRMLSHWIQRPKVKRSLDRAAGSVLFGFGLALAFDRRR